MRYLVLDEAKETELKGFLGDYKPENGSKETLSDRKNASKQALNNITKKDNRQRRNAAVTGALEKMDDIVDNTGNRIRNATHKSVNNAKAAVATKIGLIQAEHDRKAEEKRQETANKNAAARDAKAAKEKRKEERKENSFVNRRKRLRAIQQAKKGNGKIEESTIFSEIDFV